LALPRHRSTDSLAAEADPSTLPRIHLRATARSGLAEFRRGWPVVVGANLGIAVGVTAFPGFSLGVFMRGLQAEFGWTRAQISLSETLLILMVGLASPGLGWLADRIRPAWICASGLAVLALGLALLSRLGANVHAFQATYAAIGILACGAGALPFARAVSGSFNEARGLALGLSMVGTGLSAMLVPALLAPYAQLVGWRQGYMTLAVIVALATPIVAILLACAPAGAAPASGTGRADGAAFPASIRSRAFWVLATSFLLIPLALAGLLFHLIAYLRDAGLSPAKAGAIAAIAGAVQIASRVLAGWLVDRMPAQRVAAGMTAASGLCLAALAAMGPHAALLAPIAFGLAMGAEIDLVGYMTARWFGMRSYGRLYGLLYGAAMLGAAISPVVYGKLYDETRSYVGAICLGSIMLLASALLFLLMPRPVAQS
jgi:MFS family permease